MEVKFLVKKKRHHFVADGGVDLDLVIEPRHIDVRLDYPKARLFMMG